MSEAQYKQALEAIAKSSTRPGPPDIAYWIGVANDRREIARQALTQVTGRKVYCGFCGGSGLAHEDMQHVKT
jgi:hypothetical protein